MKRQRFQVNLGGVIDLLSNHLYSSPTVFVRELMQNAADAIRARQKKSKKHVGELRFSILRDADVPMLIAADDGIGLTLDEMHQFLATIGESSKRGTLLEGPNDFIGRFGIGLLSCFMVSDEIVVRSRSIGADAETVEWRGSTDGTYSVRVAEEPLDAPGTVVTLRARKDRHDFFDPERIAELATHYGGHLPIPIRVQRGGGDWVTVNPNPFPWKRHFEDARERREAFLRYGREIFGTEFLDVIPLRARAGDVEGLAFVLASASHLGAKQKHRVYLKNMLLTEDASELLPPWAFFIRCVVNTSELRPTASRESFFDDEVLRGAREELGASVREYLMTLAREAPEALQKLLALHSLAMRGLALEDDEFFRLIADWLPYETSLGSMTLGEIRRAHSPIRYVQSVDGFRQVARVAGAQGVCVINGGYVHGSDVLERVPAIFSGTEVELFSHDDLTSSMEDLSLDERDLAAPLLRAAEASLRPFDVGAEVRKFHPTDLPALYVGDDSQLFDRTASRTRENSDELYGALIDAYRAAAVVTPAKLVLNLHNPVIAKLTKHVDSKASKLFIEVLYVQSLLLGHHPLNARELAVMNKGLLDLMSAHLSSTTRARELH